MPKKSLEYKVRCHSFKKLMLFYIGDNTTTQSNLIDVLHYLLMLLVGLKNRKDEAHKMVSRI